MIDRLLLRQVRKRVQMGANILIFGPRQTGKTTLFQQLNPDRVIDLAHPDLRQTYEASPGKLIQEIEALSTLHSKLPLVLVDEVQKVPDIMDSIQYCIDKKWAQFLITGSSARKIKNLLPGRVIRFQLDPLTYLELKDHPVDLESLLAKGSLPGLFGIPDKQMVDEILSTYVQTYLEEEVRKEALVRNLAAFSQALRLACIESGNQVNFTAIAQNVGVSVPTLIEYYRILEDCMIIERFEPITLNPNRRRLTKNPKLLIFDMGVRRMGGKEGISEKMKPHLFESWVGLELRRLSRFHQPMDIGFWRDHAGPEVDWVIQKENQFIPIEVKWTSLPTEKDCRHLLKFINEYQCQQGYIICKTQFPLQITRNILVLPYSEVEKVFSFPVV